MSNVSSRPAATTASIDIHRSVVLIVIVLIVERRLPRLPFDVLVDPRQIAPWILRPDEHERLAVPLPDAALVAERRDHRRRTDGATELEERHRPAVRFVHDVRDLTLRVQAATDAEQAKALLRRRWRYVHPPAVGRQLPLGHGGVAAGG